MKNKIILFNILFFINSALYCQDTNFNKASINGLSLYYGIGQIGIRDEYISNEKYSGTANCFGAYWTRDHGKYLYKIGIEYLYSNELKNNNISSRTKNMFFHQAYIYKIQNDKKSMLALGPSVSISFLENSPNIAGNSINSVAGFLHLGLDGLY